MSAWSDRRIEIIQAVQELPTRQSCPALPTDELLHRTILRCLDLQNARKELPPPLKRVASTALAIEDFLPISTLSSSGPFNRVELVLPGSTLTGRKTPSGPVLVIKTVDRRWAFRMRRQQCIAHELAVLKLGRIPAPTDRGPARIPCLAASFLSSTSCHVVLPHAQGGDLWSLLESRTAQASNPTQPVGLPEEWVQFWIAQLVDVVDWLHRQGWTHRDIKPHNLLLLGSGHLQVTDFGSAAPLSPSSGSTTASVACKYALALVGTPDYIAPEILQHAEKVAEDSFDFESTLWKETERARAYGCEVDWWSVGIVAYELLFGQAPFFAEAIAETYERIVAFEENLEFPETMQVSQDARDFITGLLVEASQRTNISEIKQQSWFRSFDWPTIRQANSPYVPPPFQLPVIPASTSFSHRRQSSASFTSFSNSFFSSPGLSILRPSPATQETARTEEREYWEAADIGGLTVLPSLNAFDSTHDNDLPPRDLSPLIASPAVPVRSAARSSYETPARPLRDRFGTRVANDAPSSSARSRRLVTDVEAWKEMQEHAWEVGMSTRKQGRKPQPIEDQQHDDIRPGSTNAGSGSSSRVELGHLEARHEEMVKELEEMGRKYGSLFELASLEGAK
ncbi:uncharacterized protein JCM15063_000737 [Sporobolomyces koalae]|uniref:uncharacterized protein n=1 Tax=Sporobolomyces koalae TaxID=500713 RepID=UPI00317AD92D